MNEGICRNCKFFSMKDQTCHRYAPKPLSHRNPTSKVFDDDCEVAWPSMDEDDWCGEFEKDNAPLRLTKNKKK
jgi:hypothetical protein